MSRMQGKVALITGGAFIQPSTMQFFYDLGIPVANGYGLTETSPVVTLGRGFPVRPSSVGKVLDGDAALTLIEPLDREARREEIARMLAGSEVTDEARAAAARLLDGAAT